MWICWTAYSLPIGGLPKNYALHLPGPGQKKLAAGRKVAQLTADRLLAALSEEEMGVLYTSSPA